MIGLSENRIKLVLNTVLILLSIYLVFDNYKSHKKIEILIAINKQKDIDNEKIIKEYKQALEKGLDENFNLLQGYNKMQIEELKNIKAKLKSRMVYQKAPNDSVLISRINDKLRSYK